MGQLNIEVHWASAIEIEKHGINFTPISDLKLSLREILLIHIKEALS